MQDITHLSHYTAPNLISWQGDIMIPSTDLEVNESMPKAVYVAPPLNTADIPAEGAMVIIDDVRIVEEQWTKLGTVSKGVGLNVLFEGKKYSQLFSLDAKVITGSIGRLLVSVGIEDTDAKDFKEKLKALVGKEVKVVKKDGKVYWYPTLDAQ